MPLPLRGPMIHPTIPPGVVPGERRITWEQVLNKPGTSGSTNLIDPSGILGQSTTAREFLRSQGTGASPGTPAWDTLLLADLPTNGSATRKFVRSVSSGSAVWDTLVPADVTGDNAATRKFLRSLGSGASPGTTVWDTLTAADIGAGTFPSGTFAYQGLVDLSNASAGQVKFPASPNLSANANTLDAYAEGTFTPVANVVTFSAASGSYTRIGNAIHITMDVTQPATADGNPFLITGLPFAASANNFALAKGFTTSTTDAIFYVGSSTAVVNSCSPSGGGSAFSNASMSGKRFVLSGIYLL